jgi:hypothetical protein
MAAPGMVAPDGSTRLAVSWRDMPEPSTSRSGVTTSVLVGAGLARSSLQAVAATPRSALVMIERLTGESVLTGPLDSLTNYTLSILPVTTGVADYYAVFFPRRSSATMAASLSCAFRSAARCDAPDSVTDS